MSPRRILKPGPLARFLAGMDAKTIALLATMLAGLGGVKVQSDQKAAAATAQIEARVDTVKTLAVRGARLRARVDSLEARYSRDSTAWRREMRAMRREVAALRRSRPAALNGPPAPVEASGDDDEDDEPFGPAPAPAAAEKPKGKAGGVFGWFKRNLGGG